jgi:excisionase family DNA binding protein
MKLITIKELSKLLSVKTSTLYAWVHNGTIPAYKIGGALRFDPVEIEEVVVASKVLPPDVRTLGKKATKTQDIDTIVKKAIEGVKSPGYNPSKRETRPRSGSQGRRF